MEQHKGDITLRLATSVADYEAFAAIIRAYLDSLGFVVDFQDVDVELSELAVRYGEAGAGSNAANARLASAHRTEEATSALPAIASPGPPPRILL